MRRYKVMFNPDSAHGPTEIVEAAHAMAAIASDITHT